jgi:ParB family transcriptional regulator, chromosome partitioning protein
VPEFREVPMADIDEPELAIRATMDEQGLDELAASMARIGLINPLTLKPRDLRFEIEAGHRRFMAAQKLGWRRIRALIYQPDELVEHASKLAENACREDVNAAEEARWFFELMDRYSFDEAQLCEAVRRTPDYVGDRLRLLRDDPAVYDALLHRRINFSVARELNKCPDEQHRRYLLHQAIQAGTSARVVANWVAQHKAHSAPAPAPSPQPDAPAVDATVQAPDFSCALCGGFRDPYNIIPVMLHKHEWDVIKKAYLSAPEERES